MLIKLPTVGKKLQTLERLRTRNTDRAGLATEYGVLLAPHTGPAGLPVGLPLHAAGAPGARSARPHQQ
ncbi:hypothetical protein D3C71_1652910 [compost metagenome]